MAGILPAFLFVYNATPSVTKNYTYDAIGRAKTVNSTNLTYDIFNNMTGYGNDTYTYDDQNTRIRKTEAGKTTYYVTGGMDVLSEYDGSNNLLAEYVYGANGMVTKMLPDSGYFWYYKDHLGSLRLLAEYNIKVQSVDYLPYGKELTQTGSGTAYKFTGKELDNTSGLYYFGARYYDPLVGRWVVPDALSVKYSNISPYSYCFNNPFNAIDRDGRDVILLYNPVQYLPYTDISGHTALLIGNDYDGWRYFSRSGEKYRISGRDINYANLYFKSINDFVISDNGKS